jgi:hypothetical protein
MILFVTPETVRRPASLAGADPTRPFLRLGIGVLPRRPLFQRIFWRMLLEHSLTRYVLALLPFPIAILVWPDLALPISQAPLLMIGIVLFIESNVLSIGSPEKRRRLIEPAEAERALDLLNARARTILTRVAAERGLTKGSLHLVVEQSAMARVTPLTLVSVQDRDAVPPVLALDAAEREAVCARLFDAAFGERDLQRINLAENRFQRAWTIESRSVSAHARLAALARTKAAAAPRELAAAP